jgi:hypothetical protein
MRRVGNTRNLPLSRNLVQSDGIAPHRDEGAVVRDLRLRPYHGEVVVHLESKRKRCQQGGSQLLQMECSRKGTPWGNFLRP